MNCPGSVLAPGVGKQTEYAAEGTAAHSLSEWVRETGRPASDWKGKVLKVGDFEFKVGKGLIDSVTTFAEEVAREGSGPALTEEMVWYEELVPGGFGTLDHARLNDGVCLVKDFKHGKGVEVYAKDNAQMKLYAVSLFFRYKWVYDFDQFVLSICQPRRKHFDEMELSLGHLLQWAYDEVRPAAKLALTPGAPFKAGNWCKFCKIKDECRVRAKWKMDESRGGGDEYEDLTGEAA
jgi:Protein of unknown function (DUF2800)